MMRRCFVVVIACAFACLAQLAVAQTKRSITDKDLFRFQWIGDPQVLPDGTHVVFVRVTVNEKKDGYDTALWMVNTASLDVPVRLTSAKRDTQPRWSPDGKWIAFVRGPADNGAEGRGSKPQPSQLALLSLSGGEAWTITDLPRSAASPVWSPDGKQIAFLCDATPEDLAKKQKKDTGEPEHESDVKVITRAIYRFNGTGYLDPKHTQHIWILDLPASADAKAAPRQLTSGAFDERGPIFTTDGKKLLYYTNRNPEPYYELPKTEIMSIATSGGTPESLATLKVGGLLGGVGEISLSPNGKALNRYGLTQNLTCGC